MRPPRETPGTLQIRDEVGQEKVVDSEMDGGAGMGMAREREERAMRTRAKLDRATPDAAVGLRLEPQWPPD